MKQYRMVTIQQMRDALADMVNSKFPLKITLRNGEMMVRYVRGFADQQRNILLIAENAYTLALKIVEIKDIRQAEFAVENTAGEWKTLRAKWMEQSLNLL